MRGVLLMDVPVVFDRGTDISYLPPTPARLGIGSRNKSSGPVLSDARGKIFVPEKFVSFFPLALRRDWGQPDGWTAP
jgi:hypothetical protein